MDLKTRLMSYSFAIEKKQQLIEHFSLYLRLFQGVKVFVFRMEWA